MDGLLKFWLPLTWRTGLADGWPSAPCWPHCGGLRCRAPLQRRASTPPPPRGRPLRRPRCRHQCRAMRTGGLSPRARVPCPFVTSTRWASRPIRHGCCGWRALGGACRLPSCAHPGCPMEYRPSAAGQRRTGGLARRAILVRAPRCGLLGVVPESLIQSHQISHNAVPAAYHVNNS